MYNLFVTADCDAWDGSSATFALSRCLREYTEDALKSQYADLSESSVVELLNFPCLFAYETGCNRSARVGHLTNVSRRRSWVRVEYVLDAKYPEIPVAELSRLKWDLDISNWEMGRTHWALKDIDLHTVLSHSEISGVETSSALTPPDVTLATFDVALSFPGDKRPYARAVADRLSILLGRQRVFYDEYYEAQLARPNLDTLLQDIYRNRSRLVVAFLSASYQKKDWCGIEFKAIRDILKQRDDTKVMYVRHDAGHVAGVFSTDGYIDATTRSPVEVADMILERVRLKPREDEA